MKIAKTQPFDGKPEIHLASVFGASIGKMLMCRIPVTGKRPVNISVSGLKKELTLSCGIIKGTVNESCSFDVKITAENELGKAEKNVTFKITQDGPLLTPLMGFTSWNAFGDTVTQENMEESAKFMCDSGLADYGYCYVNLDSGWQDDYGGKFDAIMPNYKFKDMKQMCDNIHALGLKCGIYSTPMLYAWGSIYGDKTHSGCTRGEPDILFTNANNGIGIERMEKNNALQWEEWGFDYLKYDWDPTDPVNADYMKQELLKLNREIAFCVTVYASHFYDLDMLEIGHLATNSGKTGITENEALFSFTLRAFFMSPIQLSCRLTELTEFEYNLFCNAEILAIHHDSLANYPKLVYESGDCKLYKRALENGDTAWAFFNASDEPVKGVIGLDDCMTVRNLWTHEDLFPDKLIRFDAEPHTAYVYRTSKIK